MAHFSRLNYSRNTICRLINTNFEHPSCHYVIATVRILIGNIEKFVIFSSVWLSSSLAAVTQIDLPFVRSIYYVYPFEKSTTSKIDNCVKRDKKNYVWENQISSKQKQNRRKKHKINTKNANEMYVIWFSCKVFWFQSKFNPFSLAKKKWIRQNHGCTTAQKSFLTRNIQNEWKKSMC